MGPLSLSEGTTLQAEAKSKADHKNQPHKGEIISANPQSGDVMKQQMRNTDRCRGITTPFNINKQWECKMRSMKMNVN